LNEEEDGLVRDAQEIDERIKVFMKIADRRLNAVANGPAEPTDEKAKKQAEKELREWGPVPKVSRAELLDHYARAISEAIAKLEDAHERNPKSSALTRALKTLQEATGRHLSILKSLGPLMKEEKETRALGKAIDQATEANDGAREAIKGR
jgi:hypothetical protein